MNMRSTPLFGRSDSAQVRFWRLTTRHLLCVNVSVQPAWRECSTIYCLLYKLALTDVRFQVNFIGAVCIALWCLQASTLLAYLHSALFVTHSAHLCPVTDLAPPLLPSISQMLPPTISSTARTSSFSTTTYSHLTSPHTCPLSNTLVRYTPLPERTTMAAQLFHISTTTKLQRVMRGRFLRAW